MIQVIILSILITIAFSAVVSIVILVIIKRFMKIRVTKEEEIQGLDLSEYGESAYPAFNGID